MKLKRYRCAILAAIVVVLVVVLVVALAAAGRSSRGACVGLWVGDPGFMREAGLGDLQLYLSPPDADGDRQGYLILADDQGSVITSQACDVKMSSPGLGCAVQKLCRGRRDVRVRISFEFDDPEAVANLFPSELVATFSPDKGSLSLADDEKMYAFLWKDCAASAAALKAREDAAPPDGAEPEAPPQAAENTEDGGGGAAEGGN